MIIGGGTRAMEWGEGFDPQPTLMDDSVMMRPLTANDWDALFAVASDPELWAGHPAHDRWQQTVFRRFFDDAITCGSSLVMIDRTNGAIIGSSRYDHSEHGPDEIVIGRTFLARSHWGGATNGAVKALMITHAHKSYPVCVFMVGETNIRSRRALEKIGATQIPGRSFDLPMAGGVMMPHISYRISREASS
jgi:N-acetyltransferase